MLKTLYCFLKSRLTDARSATLLILLIVAPSLLFLSTGGFAVFKQDSSDSTVTNLIDENSGDETVVAAKKKAKKKATKKKATKKKATKKKAAKRKPDNPGEQGKKKAATKKKATKKKAKKR